ncbi:DUF2066 domain-containing protein [Thalassomonas sp. M1454]|uniref:DUF2066 domain-containing protein n=1 Tax=Thalassomonas sp. M1454 TaxID=2594477 RepID=UPI00117D124A|nr:DUF2066 domain-containing protein [Thalassomonas sp. M1454]TRX56998.1 DUF2066 domain-containing protein [Thalassomonas sp. M1454]
MNIIKNISKLIFSTTFLTCALSSTAFAIEVDDLYQAKIKVESQASSDRNKAQQQAFKQVLIKLAGKETVYNNEVITKALNRPNNYINQFSYSLQESDTYLVASFEAGKVNKLLQSAQAKIWGKHRPLSTVWVIDEQGQQRTIIGDLSSHPINQTIKESAQANGLPINFPLMDLSDSMNVSMADVWGKFESNLLQASERYLAESIIIMRVSNSTLLPVDCNDECKSFALDWQFQLNDEIITGSYQGDDKQQLVSKAVNDIANKLHQSFSYTFNEEGGNFLDVKIINVANLTEFIEISDFFTNMTLVEDVQLIKVSGENMIFRLNVVADKNAIMQALKLEQNLVENSLLTDSELQSEESLMSFTWKG